MIACWKTNEMAVTGAQNVKKIYKYGLVWSCATAQLALLDSFG